MNSIADLYQQAQLSEAAYADFDRYPTVAKALEAEGMSTAQADDFVTHWKIIAHQTETASGYSATLFESLDTPGKFSYGIRGTKGPADLSADINDIVTDGLAIDQLVDLYNDWQRITHAGVYQAAVLTTLTDETINYNLARTGAAIPVLGLAATVYLALLRARTDIIIDEPLGLVRKIEFKNSNLAFADERATGLNKLPDAGNVTVTGHSLGGHLAAAFSRLFGANAITINGAGFATGLIPGTSGNAPTNIRNLFAKLGGAAAFDSSRIQNVHGDGWNFVTMNSPVGLAQPGSPPLEIYIENVGWDNKFGHGSPQMVDSLALYNLLAKLDLTLNTGAPSSIAKITALLKAGFGRQKNLTKNLSTAINTDMQRGKHPCLG